jgi:peptidoglycan/LPS O-acetylase OafA/YrhL
MNAPARGNRLLTVAVAMFGVGVAAVVAIFVLFATGSTDLPPWLWGPAMLVPVALLLGLVAVVRRPKRR